MLLQNKSDVYNVAFGKVIFSNSKLDVYMEDGKLCEVNRDLLVFFSPFIKKLLKELPVGIKPSIILPDVSVATIKHIFKIISYGFTDFISIKDLKDAGDILGVSLAGVEYVEKEETTLSSSRYKKKVNSVSVKKLPILSEIKIKKETFEDVSIKNELIEDSLTNVKTTNKEVEVTAKLNEFPIHATDESSNVRKKRKLFGPARMRRKMRRAQLHNNILNPEKNSENTTNTNDEHKTYKQLEDSTSDIKLNKGYNLQNDSTSHHKSRMYVEKKKRISSNQHREYFSFEKTTSYRSRSRDSHKSKTHFGDRWIKSTSNSGEISDKSLLLMVSRKPRTRSKSGYREGKDRSSLIVSKDSRIRSRSRSRKHEGNSLSPTASREPTNEPYCSLEEGEI